MIRFALAVLATAVAPLPLLAQTGVGGQGHAIRADDQARLDALDLSIGEAMRQVLAEGSDDQVALAVRALRGTGGTASNEADPAALAGDWDCRMTKIGGNLPAVSYPPFRCRIGAAGGVLQFEKLTGSQRTRGVIQRDGDRWIYLGSTFVVGEQPRDYADFPAEVSTEGTETLPDVGVFEVTGPAAARITFPQPYRESILNVLTLTR